MSRARSSARAGDDRMAVSESQHYHATYGRLQFVCLFFVFGIHSIRFQTILCAGKWQPPSLEIQRTRRRSRRHVNKEVMTSAVASTTVKRHSSTDRNIKTVAPLPPRPPPPPPPPLPPLRPQLPQDHRTSTAAPQQSATVDWQSTTNDERRRRTTNGDFAERCEQTFGNERSNEQTNERTNSDDDAIATTGWFIHNRTTLQYCSITGCGAELRFDVV